MADLTFDSTSGALTATQASAGSPVAGGRVVLAIPSAMGTVDVQIIASGSSLGSVLVAEYSMDGGATWNSTNIRSSGALQGTWTLTGAAETIIGRCSCNGWTHFAIRCTSHNAGDTITVVINAVAIADLPTSTPTGPALIGTSVTMQNAQAGNANGTALPCSGAPAAILDITVSGFTGTVTFTGTTPDGGTVNLPGSNVGTGAAANSTTAAGVWYVPLCGCTSLNAPTSGVSGGTVTVKGTVVYGATMAPLPTASSTVYDGTQNASGSAVALNSGTSQACSSVLVQNDPSNTTGNDVYVGNATSQSVRLQPGDTVTYTVNNVNLIYIKTVAGTPRVNWNARS